LWWGEGTAAEVSFYFVQPVISLAWLFPHIALKIYRRASFVASAFVWKVLGFRQGRGMQKSEGEEGW